MSDLFHRIQIAAPCEKVIEAISTTEGLSRWWTAASTAKPEVGHVNVFVFDDGAVEFHFRVDAHRQDGVHWTCVEAAKVPDEWVGTEIRFDLEADGEGTVVHFGHLGWRRTDGAMYQCNTVWGELMHRLRDEVEGNPRGPYFAG